MNKLMRNSGIILCLLILFQSCISGEKSPREQLTDQGNRIYREYQKAEALKPLVRKAVDQQERTELARQGWEINSRLLKEKVADSLQPKLLEQRMFFSARLFSIDSSIALSHEYEKLALTLKDSTLLSDAYFRLGYYYDKVNAGSAAIKYDVKGLAVAKQIRDSITFARISINLGNLLNSLSNYSDAEKVALNALDYATTNAHKASLYTVLANANSGLGQYKEKMYWQEKGLETGKDKEGELIFRNNLAIGQYRLGDKTKALELLEELHADPLWEVKDTIFDSQQKAKSEWARVHANLALVRHDLGKEGSEELYQTAQRLWEEADEKDELTALYLRMAEFYEKDLETAREYARMSLQAARESKNQKATLKALHLLTQISPNPKAYALEYQQLNEAWLKEFTRSKDDFARYSFDVENTRKENEILEAHSREQQAALERNRIINITLTVVFVLLIIGGYQTYRLTKIRYKLKQSEAVRKTESRISKQIHDELANDLFSAMTYAETNDLSKPTYKDWLLDNLERLYIRTRNISREHASIPLGLELKDSLLSLISQYRDENTNILVKGLNDMDWAGVSEVQQEALYRTLQELLVNMKKHAQASLVVLQFNKEGKKLRITYKDNGKGIASQGTCAPGGLQNAKSRITQSGGHFKLDSAEGKGVKVEMSYS
ncbi:hypothetical protein E7Z59_02630 [Robertkochia marina]|uniref:histidine kinase n=1 Tax=Robertkochia marina TaxID=1227945 RepID=A0A4S3M3D0_9FLAO|nr:ATP-binding protein [Robertkochia marina]THD69245.1 hypothetical protein E7Z59_02630 [Robertkochia marina]